MSAVSRFCAAFVLLLLPASAVAGDGGDGTRVPFETIMQGSYAERRSSGEEVVRSQGEYERIWRQTQSGSSSEPDVERGATEVDFDREMVIAVFMGQQNSGGYAVEVDEILLEERGVTVYYRERSPGAGDATTQALTSPYHLVRLPRLSRDIRFSRRN
ncbi:MAG: protease complex subunit PrcB family protein [Spirochaetales bacterium]